MIGNRKLGLSLSGGGYRAAAFHLGTMRKLKEMDLLDKVDILSTISGGSIAGACYCTREGSFEDYERDMKTALTTKDVIRSVFLSVSFLQLLLFVIGFLVIAIYFAYSRYPLISFLALGLMILLLIIFQYRIFPVGREIEKAYKEFFYQDKTLNDLRDYPELVMSSTNLQTARPFSFARKKMEDSTYSFSFPPVKFKQAKFPLARAVYASSCVPFAFTPVKIDAEYFEDLEDLKRVNPALVDGGVYDNQGIHKITEENSSYTCGLVIVSDAGNKLPFEGSYNNAVILLIRTMNVFMERIKRFQQIEHIYENVQIAKKPIAYISLGWDLDKLIPGFIDNLQKGQVIPEIVAKHNIPPDWLQNIPAHRLDIQQLLETNTGYGAILANQCNPQEKELAHTAGTNLKPFTMARVNALAKYAESITELQVKLYL